MAHCAGAATRWLANRLMRYQKGTMLLQLDVLLQAVIGRPRPSSSTAATTMDEERVWRSLLTGKGTSSVRPSRLASSVRKRAAARKLTRHFTGTDKHNLVLKGVSYKRGTVTTGSIVACGE